jgi:hypothetical protein
MIANFKGHYFIRSIPFFSVGQLEILLSPGKKHENYKVKLLYKEKPAVVDK